MSYPLSWTTSPKHNQAIGQGQSPSGGHLPFACRQLGLGAASALWIPPRQARTLCSFHCSSRSMARWAGGPFLTDRLPGHRTPRDTDHGAVYDFFPLRQIALLPIKEVVLNQANLDGVHAGHQSSQIQDKCLGHILLAKSHSLERQRG